MCPHCFAVWRAVIKTLAAVLLSLVFCRLSRCYFPVVGVEIDDNDNDNDDGGGPRQCPNNRNRRRRLLWMQAVSRRPEVTVTLRSSDVIPLTTTDRPFRIARANNDGCAMMASVGTNPKANQIFCSLLSTGCSFAAPATVYSYLVSLIDATSRWDLTLLVARVHV